MKKLQTSIKEATQGFDDTLTKLFERKVKSEMVIYQVRRTPTHTHPPTFSVSSLLKTSFLGGAENCQPRSLPSH